MSLYRRTHGFFTRAEVGVDTPEHGAIRPPGGHCCGYDLPMRPRPLVIGLLVTVVVVVVIGIVAGPSLYRAARGGDDAPVTSISDAEAKAPVGSLDGPGWSCPATNRIEPPPDTPLTQSCATNP